MAQLGLDGVLTDVEVAAEFAVRHSGREEGQEFAFALGKPDLAPRPAQRSVDRGALGASGQDDAFAARGSDDAINDLLGRYRLGDKSLCASTHGVTHRLGVVGEAEYNDRAGTRVG